MRDLPKVDNPIPLPERFQDLHEIYTATNERVDNGPGVWDSNTITVHKDGEPIFQYLRTYSFNREFEPFRQLQGDRWHDYALISASYTTFQVLDLEAREIVATRPYPEAVVPERWFTEMPKAFEPGGWLEGKQPGDTYRQEGFCPVEFYVPDPFEGYYPGEEDGQQRAPVEKYSAYEYFQKDVQKAQGNFGFYSGCVWGDDSSWKLRGIDLSKISEGVVADDERFGYWELPDGRLKNNVDWEYGTIKLGVHVNMETGEASAWTKDNLNWAGPREQ